MRIKRITAAVITAIVIITMSFSAFAEDVPVIDMGTFHNVYIASDGSFNLSEWDYDITNFDENEYIVLEKYNGTDKEITIEGKARKNGKEYQVLLGITYDFETYDYISLFDNNTDIEKVTFLSVDGVGVGISGSIGADNLFKGCTALREVDFNNSLVRSGDTGLYSINSMFEGCTSLQKADLSELDLSECVEAKDVFKGCTGVTEVCLDGDDFSKIYTVSGMFEGCTSL